jgi:hypothetical protein
VSTPTTWKNPAWWTTVAGMIGAAVGTFDPNIASDVRATCAAAGALVIAVYTLAHHLHLSTITKAETAAAAVIAAAKTKGLDASAAQAAGFLHGIEGLVARLAPTQETATVATIPPTAATGGPTT